MIETECQKLVVDAVTAHGGRALKFNNQFLVGVVDLLIKLPTYPAFVLEAKKNDFAASTINRDGAFTFNLDVTTKQKQFLNDWYGAGMRTGVISFIQQKGSNVNSLRVACYSKVDLRRRGWVAMIQDHVPLGDKSRRNETLVAMLTSFAGG